MLINRSLQGLNLSKVYRGFVLNLLILILKLVVGGLDGCWLVFPKMNDSCVDQQLPMTFISMFFTSLVCGSSASAGGWNEGRFKVLSYPNHSRIFWKLL